MLLTLKLLLAALLLCVLMRLLLLLLPLRNLLLLLLVLDLLRPCRFFIASLGFCLQAFFLPLLAPKVTRTFGDIALILVARL